MTPRARGESQLLFPPESPSRVSMKSSFPIPPVSNRAKKTPITIMHADGEQKVYVDQTKQPPILGAFVSLGAFRFEKGTRDVIQITTEDTSQVVIADAIRLLSKTEKPPPVLAKKEKSEQAKEELKKKQELAKAQKKASGKGRLRS